MSSTARRHIQQCTAGKTEDLLTTGSVAFFGRRRERERGRMEEGREEGMGKEEKEGRKGWTAGE